MNIGDKVRFLNTTGGGRIAGFQGKDLVLVCDDDGFEIPTLRSEIVVIETDNYNLVRKPVPSKERPSTHEADGMSHTSIKAALGCPMLWLPTLRIVDFYRGFGGGRL